VCNPTNPDERFCESFRTSEQYEAFVDFITRFRGEVETLLMITGFPELNQPLSRMFGERITKRALTEFSTRLTDARISGNLQVDSLAGKGRLTIAGVAAAGSPPQTGRASSPSGRIIPPNTFYGE
jgi:hypothetical protein